MRSYDDDLREAARLFEQALSEAGDDDGLRGAAAHEGAAATLFRLRERLAALALQEATEHRRVLSRPLFCAGVVWLWSDELERARGAFRRLYRAGREMAARARFPTC